MVLCVCVSTHTHAMIHTHCLKPAFSTDEVYVYVCFDVLPPLLLLGGSGWKHSKEESQPGDLGKENRKEEEEGGKRVSQKPQREVSCIGRGECGQAVKNSNLCFSYFATLKHTNPDTFGTEGSIPISMMTRFYVGMEKIVLILWCPDLRGSTVLC